MKDSVRFSAALAVVLALLSSALAVDSISKSYFNSADRERAQFEEIALAAKKNRDDQIKTINDAYVSQVRSAFRSLEAQQKKAMASTVNEYDNKIREITKTGDLDKALALKGAKEAFLKDAAEGNQRLDEEFHTLLGDNSDSSSDSILDNMVKTPDDRIVPQRVKITLLPMQTFLEKYKKAFPVSAILSRDGSATVSGTETGSEDPSTVFAGVRYHQTWVLDRSKGWFYATWPKPVVGQYLLIFSRPTPAENDRWGKARLLINRELTLTIDGMGPQQVLFVDFGHPVPIRSVRVDIDGAQWPGISSLEIHREMKK